MAEPGPGEAGFIDTRSIKFDSKVKKGMKQMGKLFKGVGKVGHPAMMAASAFGEMADKMGVMDAIMQGLSPLFDIISSLMTVLSNSIMSALMPAIQPLIDMLPTLIPIIQMIGEFIGQTLAIGLIPLLTLLEMFLPIIEPLLPIIFQLLELGLIPLMVMFEVIFAVLEPLLPYIQQLADGFGALEPIISLIADVLVNVFMGALYGVAIGFAVIIDAFTFGMAGAVDYVRDLFSDLFPDEEETTTPTPTATPAPHAGIERYGPGQFTKGTEMIIKSGYIPVEAGEAIQPAGLVGRESFLLEEMLLELKITRKEKKRDDFFNRRGR